MTIKHRARSHIKGLLSYDLFLVLVIPMIAIWGAWQYSVTVDNKIWAFHPPIVEGPLPKGPFSEYRKTKPPDDPPVAMDLTVPVSLLQALATSSAVYLQYVIGEARALEPAMTRWRWEVAGLCDRIMKEPVVI